MATAINIDPQNHQNQHTDTGNVTALSPQAGVVAEPVKCNDTIQNFAEKVSFSGVFEFFGHSSYRQGCLYEDFLVLIYLIFKIFTGGRKQIASHLLQWRA